MPESIYQPAEDSYLIAEALKQTLKKHNKNEINQLKFLDMGCGSGIITETSLSCGVKKQNVLAVDINKAAVRFVADKYKIRTAVSDIFNNINKKQKFNLIVFNPPYLPEHKHDREKDTSGGKKGYETTERFLQQANKYLQKSGKILLLISSLTNPDYVKNKFKDKYKIKTINNKKLFFEELFVWQMQPKELKFLRDYGK